MQSLANRPQATDNVQGQHTDAGQPPMKPLHELASSGLCPSRFWTVLTISAVVVGAVLRVHRYATAGWLSLDELFLASSILDRSLAHLLLGPLNWDQSAPLGFLVIQWAAARASGDAAELGLRAFSLLSSIAALIIFVRVARRHLSEPTATLAIALFALSPFLIYYAGEVKPYASDVLVAVLITDATFRARAGVISPRRLAYLGFAIALFSATSVFVLAGVGLALVAMRTDWRRWHPVAFYWTSGILLAGVWGMLQLGPGGRATMHEYWGEFFLPLSDPYRFVEAAYALSSTPLALPGLGLLTLAIGVTQLPRDVRWILFAPFALVVCAAVASLYPFGSLDPSPLGGRLLLFLVPALLIGVAEGVGWLATREVWWLRATGVVLVGLLPLQMVVIGTRWSVERPDMGPVLHQLDARMEPGDAVYLFVFARPQFFHYGPEADHVIEGFWRGREASAYADDFAKLPSGRVWMLFSHASYMHGGADSFPPIIDQFGRQLESFRASGAELYLYEIPSRNVGKRFGTGAPALVDEERSTSTFD
jgi:hypothetical protein